jgi:aspartyl-tRNA(Asn)/glutamyl-tRNA(Gln) amidotransferase subunit A
VTPADPSTLDEPVPDYPLTGYADLEDVRIGIPTRYFWDGIDGQVLRACRSALQRLADLGADLVEVDPPTCTEEVMALPGAYG